MALLANLFKKHNYFHHYLLPQNLTNYATHLHPLLPVVRQHMDDFLDYVDQNIQGKLSVLQKMTLLHLMLINSSELHQYFQVLILNGKDDDSWLNKSVLNPYQNFIRKLILSKEEYLYIRTINKGWNRQIYSYSDHDCKTAMRSNPKEYFNLKLLFYMINLLNQLFSFLKWVPTIGRYYLPSKRAEVEPFVVVASKQVVEIYFAFKFIINQMVSRREEYLFSGEQNEAFKFILRVNLEQINQQMKQLLLGKYFNLFDKGIRMNLYQLDRQTPQNQQLIDSLLGNKQSYNKIKKKTLKSNSAYLRNSIFKDGNFDQNLFEQSISLISSSVMTQSDLERQLQLQCEKQNRRGSMNSRVLNGSFMGKVLVGDLWES